MRARQRLTQQPTWEGRVNRADKQGEGDGYFGDYRRVKDKPPYPHQGVDIQGDQGQPVYSMGAGKVIKADGTSDARGYGNQVVIDHGDGVLTQYGHLYDFAVKPGDEVRPGQAIGRLGRSGTSFPEKADSHVHTELRIDGSRFDLGDVFPQYKKPR